MKPLHKTLLLIAAALVLGRPARAAELLVFAAASLTDAMKEIRSLYEQQAPDRIAFNFDGSSNLARQIAEGAPADVFISADEAKMDNLQKKDLILNATRKSILSNSLVIVTFRDSTLTVNAPGQLADPHITRIALADPSAVPAGIYAKAFLQNKGLWHALAEKVVPLNNVRATLAAVESGDAEVGFVYKTDAAISKNVKVIYTVLPDDCPSITYPMAALKDSKQVDAANRFLHFLETPASTAIFRKYGFIVLDR